MKESIDKINVHSFNNFRLRIGDQSFLFWFFFFLFFLFFSFFLFFLFFLFLSTASTTLGSR